MRSETARDLALAIMRGQPTSEEVVSIFIERIKRLNERLHYFITIDEQASLSQARACDATLRRTHPSSMLHGVPMSVKDVISVSGFPMTLGSRLFSKVPSKRDAECVARSKRAGLVIIGTTNLHELASGVTSVNPHYGAVLNPWDENRIAGGSSGGSAASVALGVSAISLGTDTSGSVRIPASLCGVVGFKPTYGLVGTSGVFPLAWSLDCVGILARGVIDTRLLFKEIVHSDYSHLVESRPDANLRSLRIGVPWDFFEDFTSAECLQAFKKFLDDLDDLEQEILDVEIPWMERAEWVWRVIRRSEAAVIHGRFVQKSPELIGDDVLAILKDGMKYTAVDYITAMKEKEKLTAKFDDLMENIDLLALPTTPVVAPRINEREVDINGRRVSVYEALTRYTYPFNVVGAPAISLPIGFNAEGLPIGGQLVGHRYGDGKLLDLGANYEASVNGFRMRSQTLL